MSYLQMLRELEKKSQIEAIPPLTEPTKAPSVSFVTPPPANIREFFSVSDKTDFPPASLKTEVSAPPGEEPWRDELAAQLEANPELRYVYRAGLPEDGLVKLYVAVRDVATAYFTIPAERYDPITAMMELSRLADQHYPAVDPHPYADPLR
ncbi:hypothetical protein [Ferrovum sp.]|uniref:hypothetical protein n=1 Tax=Ferrovum sp. TaxID=2609467 RepID=UPI00260D57BF|nr:hypothetical protein [Ferrovum sp.]